MDKSNVAQLRKARGWTQDHLAELCNINTRTIQRLEAGEETSLETLRLVAQALNVQVTDLFTHIGSDRKETIMAYNAAQVDQLRKRKSEKHLKYDLPRLIFVFIMLILFYGISTLGNHTFLFIIACLVWLIAWPIAYTFFNYWRNFKLEPAWDLKYPLTIGIKKPTKK
ncbi:transcriptional regulator with XRE-family HTH domain [Weissella uvarum]|uniref:helix-turn-helix domain-containing protein n=1 Tax=Weissella uvarum TaxID=1479233 RepID=UPI0019615B91|nr:helix-turn-helix transcriptional regulator [Weissella uvarum]MBM7617602.1 transcriptional regulator with XRE-family HTH domain [Weissella uvarum]MCM0595953.1 helix-turn-helix transcriptional regulator [Weissella uvarum]